MNLLTLTIILPLAGALALVFSPRDNIKMIKMIALGTSVVTLISALSMLTKYKSQPTLGSRFLTLTSRLELTG
jgi:NADH:ubiquinone oxidoreductase subunit 4 (subunit M)